MLLRWATSVTPGAEVRPSFEIEFEIFRP